MANPPPHNGEHKKPAISQARYHLVPVLSDLFAKKSFSGHKLDQTLKENHLSDANRALFTELFYGFLRYGHQLLYLVDKFLANPERMPAKAKWILAIAFYQKLYLHKIPDFALVNDAVEMTRRFLNSDPLAHAVNAILHKFLENSQRFVQLDDEPLWVQTSFPEWMSDYLSQMWSEIKFFQMAKALNSRSPTYIRVNVTKISEENLILKLTASHIVVHQTAVPHCLLISDLSLSPKDLPGYHEGWWTIQNMASQRIVRFMDIQEGHEVLDACSGFGGKTLQIAELTRDHVRLHYFDTVQKKMSAVETRVHVMGFKHVKPVTQFGQYHRILIDAPCSGLGTIASHPEIKWFRTPEDLQQHRHKQKEVLNTYSAYLMPTGKLTYAVCSIDKNEGEVVIRNFLEEHRDFEIDPDFKTPFEDTGLGAYLMPTENGESGYFFTRLRKKP